MIPRLFLATFVSCVALSPISAAPDDDLPTPVQVGKGSYATRPPRDQAARPGVRGREVWGDLSQVFTHMKLWVPEDYKGPVPSTDWWTTLVSRQWSRQLWAYPAMVKAQPDGIAIHYPKTWKLADNSKKMIMESAGRLLVRGKGFVPESKFAETWSDWLVTFREQQSPTAWMKATIGHGLPCTWIETGVDLRIDVEKPVWFAPMGAAQALPAAGNGLGVETNGDCYGIFAPAGTRFSMDGTSLAVQFTGAQRWLSVVLLPARQDMAFYARYAPVVPRSTRVAWEYSPEKGELATTWTLPTESLAGAPDLDVVQGWIPHHYDTAHGVRPESAFNNLTYPTPRGLLKCAVERSFRITYPFRGLLPELPAPTATAGAPNPYRPEGMKSLIDGYTDVTDHGSETYWGSKKILLYAKYMEMAYQLGLTQQAVTFQGKLREALVDWATYTPGEKEHFFAMYPNWGSLVGFRTRDNFEQPHFDIVASANNITGTAQAAVEESRRVSRIVLNPEPPRELILGSGTTMRFQAEAVDQFGTRYVLPITWTAAGKVQVGPDGRIRAGAVGERSFTASAGGQTVTVPVKVLSPDQVNLAAMKTVTASSVENGGSEARNAVDGNERTRWASAFSDPQWITVDLEAPYALKKIVLNGQNAAARAYEIELSTDGAHWTSAAKVIDGKPGVRAFDLTGTKARYLRITGIQRTTGYE